MNESLDTGIYYGPNADSLALRTLAYKAMLWPGQDEDAPLLEIPAFLLKRNQPEPLEDEEPADRYDDETDDTRHNDPRHVPYSHQRAKGAGE